MPFTEMPKLATSTISCRLHDFDVNALTAVIDAHASHNEVIADTLIALVLFARRVGGIMS